MSKSVRNQNNPKFSVPTDGEHAIKLPSIMLSIETYKQTDICQPKDDDSDDEDGPYTRIFENHECISESEEEIDKINTEEGTSEDHSEIFQSKEHMNASILKLFYGDLYVIGRIWIETLKTILVGAQLRLVPVVHAAKPPPEPTKPPKMRYKDLPIYESPHYDYKEHEGKKEVCPAASQKLMHSYLLPYVKQYRTSAQSQLCSMKCLTKSVIKETGNSLCSTGNDIKKYMRDPNNLQIRQGFVGTGTLLGYFMGTNIPKKLFFAGLGGLSTGALCFPEETDEVFRTFMAHTGTVMITLYNTYCGKSFALRGRVPCTTEVPPEPPKRPKPQCPKPKK